MVEPLLSDFISNSTFSLPDWRIAKKIIVNSILQFAVADSASAKTTFSRRSKNRRETFPISAGSRISATKTRKWRAPTTTSWGASATRRQSARTYWYQFHITLFLSYWLSEKIEFITDESLVFARTLHIHILHLSLSLSPSHFLSVYTLSLSLSILSLSLSLSLTPSLFLSLSLSLSLTCEEGVRTIEIVVYTTITMMCTLESIKTHPCNLSIPHSVSQSACVLIILFTQIKDYLQKSSIIQALLCNVCREIG